MMNKHSKKYHPKRDDIFLMNQWVFVFVENKNTTPLITII
uniref:Uncharacterized protein n=1 Tax=Anguilla anguilla TaxID=7936 RepID=A0A0E9TG38_ANGAN